MRVFVLRRTRAATIASVLTVVTLGTLSAPALANGPAAASPEPADPNRPRLLYRQAETAFSAGRYEEARKLLLEAWGIRQSYDVAAALGQAELELKLYRDAAEHLSFAVQNFAPMESEGALEGIKSDLRSAKSQVAEARIAASERRAAISVNGRPLGESPLPTSVFLEPGSYVFEAALGPDRKTSRSMVLDRGGTYDVELSIPQGVPLVAASGAARDEGRSKSSLVPPLAAAAVGGVALVTGVGLFIAASSKDSSREDILNGLPAGTNRCGARVDLPPECKRVAELADGAAAFRTAAIASLGAAVGAGIATYLLWPKTSSHRESAFAAFPAYSPERQAFELSAQGRF